MRIAEFNKTFEEGNFTDSFELLIDDDVLSDECIYEITSELNQGKINHVGVVMLFMHLIEKTKNSSKESAFRLAVMSIRSSNQVFIKEFFTANVMQAIHESLLVLPEKLSNSVLRWIHALSNTLDNSKCYDSLRDLHKILKAEGFKLPTETLNLKMDITPPIWCESIECHICKVKFTTFARKHHCRNCGLAACGKCSSSNMPLPHFMIYAPVRVCDVCKKTLDEFDSHKDIFSIAKEVIITSVETKNDANSILAQDEDSDLKRAIQESIKEAEQRKKQQNEYEKSKKLSESAAPAPVFNDGMKSDDYMEVPMYPNLTQKQNVESIYENVSRVEYGGRVAGNDPPIQIANSVKFNQQPIQSIREDNYEIIFQNMVINISNLEAKIIIARSDPRKAVTDYALHTLFQASLAVYNSFLAAREQNKKELEKYNNYLHRLNAIEDARNALNEVRRINSHKLLEQKKESEALLRMHMEQKMYLTQQQNMEFDEFQKRLSAERMRKFDSTQQPQPYIQNQPIGMYQQQPYNYGMQPDLSGGYDYHNSQYQNIPKTNIQYSPQSGNNLSMMNDNINLIPANEQVIYTQPIIESSDRQRKPEEKKNLTLDELIFFDPPQ